MHRQALRHVARHQSVIDCVRDVIGIKTFALWPRQLNSSSLMPRFLLDGIRRVHQHIPVEPRKGVACTGCSSNARSTHPFHTTGNSSWGDLRTTRHFQVVSGMHGQILLHGDTVHALQDSAQHRSAARGGLGIAFQSTADAFCKVGKQIYKVASSRIRRIRSIASFSMPGWPSVLETRSLNAFLCSGESVRPCCSQSTAACSSQSPGRRHSRIREDRRRTRNAASSIPTRITQTYPLTPRRR